MVGLALGGLFGVEFPTAPDAVDVAAAAPSSSSSATSCNALGGCSLLFSACRGGKSTSAYSRSASSGLNGLEYNPSHPTVHFHPKTLIPINEITLQMQLPSGGLDLQSSRPHIPWALLSSEQWEDAEMPDPTQDQHTLLHLEKVKTTQMGDSGGPVEVLRL